MADDIYVRLCLQEIVKLDLEAKAIIQLPVYLWNLAWTYGKTLEFLWNFNLTESVHNLSLLKFELLDIRHEASSMEKLDDFSAKGRQKISDLRAKIAELERLGLEQESIIDKDEILMNVESLRQKLSRTVGSLRQACLITKLELDKKAKEQLLSGMSEIRRRTQGNKETLAKTSSSITESLMSLNQLMADQVKQSELNITTLVNSSQVINDTQDEFHNMGGHIQHSQRLLTKYGRREFTDRLLILLALVFFFATVLYIIKKRVWPV